MSGRMKRNAANNLARMVFGLAVAVLSIPMTEAQEPRESSGGLPTTNPQLAPGKMIAAGRSTIPIGPKQLLTYILEEVPLPKPIQLEIRGKKQQFETALRLTITSKSIQGAHVIWIDDASLPGVFGLGETRIATFVYDRTVLKDGSIISVSNYNGSELFSLPERLKLPESFKATVPPSVVEEGNTYSIRSALRIFGSIRKPLITIEFRTSRTFPIANDTYIVQIGKRFFQADASGHIASLSLTLEQFAQLKDGDLLAVSYGDFVPSHGGGAGVWEFGKLDKSKLDR